MAININELWQQQKVNSKDLEKHLNRKESESKDLLIQLANKYQSNIKWIGFGAILSLIVFPIVELYYIGIALTLTFASVFVISSKRLNALHTINKNLTCLAYLTKYRHYLRESQEFYGKIYQFIYPLLFASALLQFFASDVGADILLSYEKDGATKFLGLPLAVLFCSIISIVMVMVSSKALYKMEAQHIYGQNIDRLDRLIADLEELK